ncbi:MAG: acylphosphatase [Candidatus Omnitrophota bacterium]
MNTQKIEKKRVHIFYSGKVQGVGFRFSAESIAQELSIDGYVKNLRDGRVEVVAEANEAVLLRFITMINEHMRYYISFKDIEYSKATDEFKGFEMRL